MRRNAWKIALAVLTVATWLLLAVGYPGHLHAAEGNAMFLYTGAFAADSILIPGGLANYIGNFIIQFFYYPWAGALLVGLLAAVLAAGIAQFSKAGSSLPLTLLPSVSYVILLMDSKWTVAGLAGLAASVWAVALICRIPKTWGKVAAGALALPFVWQFFLRAKFYTYAVAPQGLWWTLVAGTAAVCIICAVLPERKAPRKKWTGITIIAAAYALIFAAGAFGVSKKYEKLDEEIDIYTYLVREGDWNGILEKAGKSALNSPLSTNAVNLALEMTGKLGDDMFRYFQSGPRSLINFEERKISSEVLFHLGFVNEAAHLTFEDMAGNPSRERGVCHITRLARCAAVDSTHSELCARYLATLDKTLFYKDFDAASEVSADMEPKDDFLFNFNDFQQMLGLLALQRPENAKARDYLAASLLLSKNLQGFEQMFGDEANPPAAHLQAHQITSALTGGETAESLQKYVNDYNACRGNGAHMQKWAGTYWYYYNFR